VFCAGVIYPLQITSQTPDLIFDSLAVNLVCVMQMCEHVLNHNPYARIVVIGSESGNKGSFDNTYAASKAGLHSYVRNRTLSHPGQQIVAVAPTIIEDTRMTQDRNDLDTVVDRAKKEPKQRLLQAKEVAECIYFLLYKHKGYITNTIIEMNGGKR